VHGRCIDASHHRHHAVEVVHPSKDLWSASP
jgi:hypothetical protein